MPSLSKEPLEIKGFTAAQHVVDGPAQPGGQDAERLLLAVLLLTPLLPGLDFRAAADEQADRFGEGPLEMGVADLLAAVAQGFAGRLVDATGSIPKKGRRFPPDGLSYSRR